MKRTRTRTRTELPNELPDVRDGLTRTERIVLTTLNELQKERGGRTVPVIELWGRLDVALFGVGGPSWGVASLGADVAAELDDARAVGEILIAPFDIHGAFICPALRERVLAFDARSLRDVPVAIGVGAGERKVQPILGALRSGAVKTLVTDVATAEAVVRADAA